MVLPWWISTLKVPLSIPPPVAFPLITDVTSFPILFLVKDFKEKETAFLTEQFHQKFHQKDDKCYFDINSRNFLKTPN